VKFKVQKYHYLSIGKAIFIFFQQFKKQELYRLCISSLDINKGLLNGE